MNKLKVLTLMFFFCQSYMAKAQISENVRFGFQVNPHLSWMKTDDKRIASNGLNGGVTIGTLAEFYLNENYIITTGLGLSFNQGGELKHELGGRLFPDSDLSDNVYDSLPSNSQLTYKVQYLEIPIGFRMRTKEFGYARFTIEAPVLTFGVRTQSRADIEAPGLPSTTDENIKEELPLFNISYGLGIGVEYSITENMSLLGGIYYKKGIIDISPDDAVQSDGTREDSQATIGNISLKIGLLF